MTQSLLGSLSFVPEKPTVGESVLVTVLDPAGKALGPDASVLVAIDGQPGSRHYVQFSRAGQQIVRALARGPAGPERIEATLTVAPFPVALPQPGSKPEAAIGWPGIGLPILQIGHLAMRPGVVGLAVGQASQLDWSNRGRVALARLPAMQIVPEGKPAPYRWSFGNGHVIDTMTPFAQYDFDAWRDVRQELQHFDICVTAAGQTVSRTLTMCNLYGKLKREARRLHLPGEATADAKAGVSGMTATVLIRNPEEQPVLLTQRRFLPVLPLRGQRTPQSEIETLHAPVQIPAGGTISIALEPTLAQVPRGSIGFGAVFGGTGPGGETVRCSVHVDLRGADRITITAPVAAQDRSAPVAAQDRRAPVAAQGPAENRPAPPRLPDLAAPSRPAPPGAASTSGTNHAMTPMSLVMHDSGPATGTPVQVGAECNPDDLPSGLPAHFACQATSEQRSVMMPARFMNARKGDSILAPGGVGLVGQLLTHVTIPQLYSHCGIMSSDYDQITHCTASDDRVEAYPVGSILGVAAPVDGFRTDILKYGWPGALTQSVDDSVNGTLAADKSVPLLKDPETPSDTYALSDFNSSPEGATINKVWTIISPMVVKPDPMVETDDHRARLHAVADQALAHVGHMHYRYYGFTDPTVLIPAPADAKWAAGTLPATCSSFIWLMFKKSGFQLQSTGPLALASDISAMAAGKGAKVSASTPDGLFLYTGAERQSAAKFFYGLIVAKVQDTVASKLEAVGVAAPVVLAALGTIVGGALGAVVGGALGALFGSNAEEVVEGLTKISSHVGNEFLNAFAGDMVQTDDDNLTWQQTGDANSVSPDDIMFWNGPTSPARGPYGYCEPLLYREPRQETVTIFRWQSFTQTGSLSGRVTFDGQPAAGARVQLYDGKSCPTDANGRYSLEGVPYGSYLVDATRTSGAVFLSASPHVTLGAPQTTLDIALALPLYTYRTVKLQGTLTTHYTFHTPIGHDKDERVPKLFYGEIALKPAVREANFSCNNTVDDASATLTIAATMQDDGSIDCKCSLNLHDQTFTKTIHINRDASGSFWATASAKNDDAQVAVTISNTLKEG